MLIVACVLTPFPSSIFPEGRWGRVCTQAMLIVFFLTISHLSNEEGTGAEMRPALSSGIVNGSGNRPLANFPLSLVTIPKVFAKVNSALFLYLFFFFLNFLNSILIAPLAPYVGEITNISASKSSHVIQLWPAEQRNGPIRYDQSLVPSLIDFRKNFPTKIHLLSNKSFCKSPNPLMLR